MREYVIHAKGLQKNYQQGLEVIRAVDDVDLDIEKGDFVVITGRSGSGKTTLLSLLGGLTLPDHGDLSLFRQVAAEMDDVELSAVRGNKLGFVFQFPSLIPTLTVFDNLRLPGLFAAQSADEERIDHLLKWVGLDNRKTSYPAELSGGQGTRVSLARALVNTPALLLADEPTGNLDVETEKEIMELLMEINRTEGTTILLVTHNPEMAVFGNRHLVMHEGKLTEQAREKPLEAARAQ